MQLRFLIVFCFLISACNSWAPKYPSKPVEPPVVESASQEISKREKLLQKQKSLPSAEQLKNKDRAKKFAQKASELFKEGEFQKALQFFSKSVQSDASVDQVYYEYAVTFYKVGLYGKAIALFDMLKEGKLNQTERQYYQALTYYKMRDNEMALSHFSNVRDAKDAVLSPLASMYAGIIETSKENYPEAKKNFEYVLDNSQDPDLDKRAEANIENLIQLEKFNEMAKQKWAYSFYTGIAHDGNVLNIAEQNASTNTEALRLMYGAAVSYKALYNFKNTLIPQFWVSDMYSLNKDFESDSAIQATDPLQAQFSAPYKYFFQSGTLSLSPAYQAIYMSLTQGSRELVFGSVLLNTSFTTSYADDWISEYKLDISKDTSHVEITDPANDQSALKYTGVFSQTKLFDEEGYKTLTMDLMYTINNTDGDNFQYSKFLTAFAGGFPMSKSRKLLGYARLDYFSMDFSKSSTDRSDNGFIGTFGSNYTLSNKSTLSFSLQYYNTSSSVALYDYDKFIISTIYSFNSGFF